MKGGDRVFEMVFKSGIERVFEGKKGVGRVFERVLVGCVCQSKATA